MTEAQSTQRNWVDRVAAEYGRGRPLALLFDYDGTLTPIVRHPSLARLTPRTRTQLGRLADLPNVGIGVISGRALDDVRSKVGLDGVYYAGSGGLEIDLLGEKEQYPQTEAIDQLLDGIQDRLLELLEKFPGTWMERKPGAIALHYRGLLPLSASCFRYEAVSLLSMVEALRIRVVSETVEVTPADGWDKGDAVASIVSHMEGGLDTPPLVVYFGDAANDTEGMAVACHTGGLSVGIGPDTPPIAEQRLADPNELADCLDELVGRLAQQGGLTEVETRTSDARPMQSEVDAGGLQPAIPSGTGPGMILLDSHEQARADLAAGMMALGWRVWQADTVERAVQQLEHHGDHVHVALVDLQLPGLQGARALSELGQSRPELIRCFLSEEVSPYMANAFGKLSDVPLFVKPLHAADADRLFQILLRKKGLALK